MNKQQLRDCFDKIRPSEALVEKTMQRVREQQTQLAATKNTSVLRMPRYAFATRLASAACALMLLVGIGVTVGKNVVTSPAMPSDDAESRGATPMTVEPMNGADLVVEPSNVSSIVGCEQMISTAQGYATDWAVFSATVDAMYFVDESEGVMVLRPDTVADKQLSTEQPGWVSDSEEMLTAHVALTNSDWQTILSDAVGGRVLIGMHVEIRAGEAVWVIHELYSELEPVQ